MVSIIYRLGAKQKRNKDTDFTVSEFYHLYNFKSASLKEMSARVHSSCG